MRGIYKHPIREKASHWKGSDVGYGGVHQWVNKEFGKATFCCLCGRNDPKRKYEWANLTGKFLRDRENWKNLCVPCHKKFDESGEKAWLKREKERTRIQKSCLLCGNLFFTYPHRIKEGRGKYCSALCSKKVNAPLIAKRRWGLI